MDKNNAKTIDAQTEKLLLLLSLQRRSRRQKTAAELAFMMVNETYQLVPYRQALFWTRENGFEAVSGQTVVEKNSPYLLWLSSFIEQHLPQDAASEAVRILTAEGATGEHKKNWQTWCSSNAAMIALRGYDGSLWGILWVDRESGFSALDSILLDELADAYGYGMHALMRPDGKKMHGWTRKLLALFVLVVFCWPVRLSATAPAEVVAKDPYIISVPFDGILAEILIEPNTQVKKGDILAKIDDTALRSQLVGAEHRLIMARSVLAEAERESITVSEKKQQLAELRADLALRQQEVIYAKELLTQSMIIAARDGVAVFSDKNDLRGRPVRAGDNIMVVSALDETELLIRIPVDAMLTINEAEPVTFFLNTAPLQRKQAHIKNLSYQASIDPDGLLTYKMRAAFAEGDVDRIGLTGTAKIYGRRSLLGYSLLRRPLISLRRLLGV